MAKVSLPLLSGEVRGKLGEIVFTKRYGKQIARRLTKPTNPKTLKQRVVRGNLSALSKAWSGKTDLADKDGKKYVILKKKNADGTYSDVTFNILTNDEKMAWEAESMKIKGYKQFGRNMFISRAIKALNGGVDAKRTP
jgi:hypothetical protein